jgi:hypothetical protein
MNRIRQGCPESLNSQPPFFFYQKKAGETQITAEKDKGVFCTQTKKAFVFLCCSWTKGAVKQAVRNCIKG